MYHEEMATAQEFGISPDDWYRQSRAARAVAVARRRAESIIGWNNR